MFIYTYTDKPKMHFLSSLKTHCFCLETSATVLVFQSPLLCFILEFCPGYASFWRTFWFPWSTAAQCKWHCTVIHTENNQLRSWPFIKSYWFSSFPSIYSGKELWQVVFTRLIGQVMRTVTPFKLSSAISGTFHVDLLCNLKRQAVCWY